MAAPLTEMTNEFDLYRVVGFGDDDGAVCVRDSLDSNPVFTQTILQARTGR